MCYPDIQDTEIYVCFHIIWKNHQSSR